MGQKEADGAKQKIPNDCTLCRANGAGRVGCAAMIALLSVFTPSVNHNVQSTQSFVFSDKACYLICHPRLPKVSPGQCWKEERVCTKKPRCHIEWCWQKPKVSHQKLIRYQSPLVPHHNWGTKLFAHPDVCMFHTHLQRRTHCTPGPGRGNRVGDTENWVPDFGTEGASLKERGAGLSLVSGCSFTVSRKSNQTVVEEITFCQQKWTIPPKKCALSFWQYPEYW